MGLGGFPAVFSGGTVMAVRVEGLLCCLRVLSGSVVLGRFLVVLGSLSVMFGGLAVVFGGRVLF